MVAEQACCLSSCRLLAEKRRGSRAKETGSLGGLLLREKTAGLGGLLSPAKDRGLLWLWSSLGGLLLTKKGRGAGLGSRLGLWGTK